MGRETVPPTPEGCFGTLDCKALMLPLTPKGKPVSHNPCKTSVLIKVSPCPNNMEPLGVSSTTDCASFQLRPQHILGNGCLHDFGRKVF